MRLKAQNLTEFAVCLVVVASAILGMQIYAQRGLMARYKAPVDSLLSKLGKKSVYISEPQYDPEYRTSISAVTANSKRKKLAGGREDINNVSARVGWEATAPPSPAEKVINSLAKDKDGVTGKVSDIGEKAKGMIRKLKIADNIGNESDMLSGLNKSVGKAKNIALDAIKAEN